MRGSPRAGAACAGACNPIGSSTCTALSASHRRLAPPSMWEARALLPVVGIGPRQPAAYTTELGRFRCPLLRMGSGVRLSSGQPVERPNLKIGNRWAALSASKPSQRFSEGAVAEAKATPWPTEYILLTYA